MNAASRKAGGLLSRNIGGSIPRHLFDYFFI